jgi:hypothetical protein
MRIVRSEILCAGGKQFLQKRCNCFRLTYGFGEISSPTVGWWSRRLTMRFGGAPDGDIHRDCTFRSEGGGCATIPCWETLRTSLACPQTHSAPSVGARADGRGSAAPDTASVDIWVAVTVCAHRSPDFSPGGPSRHASPAVTSIAPTALLMQGQTTNSFGQAREFIAYRLEALTPARRSCRSVARQSAKGLAQVPAITPGLSNLISHRKRRNRWLI